MIHLIYWKCLVRIICSAHSMCSATKTKEFGNQLPLSSVSNDKGARRNGLQDDLITKMFNLFSILRLCLMAAVCSKCTLFECTCREEQHDKCDWNAATSGTHTVLNHCVPFQTQFLLTKKMKFVLIICRTEWARKYLFDSIQKGFLNPDFNVLEGIQFRHIDGML